MVYTINCKLYKANSPYLVLRRKQLGKPKKLFFKISREFIIFALDDILSDILQIQHECKLEVVVDEYVEAAVRPFLMDVIYCWSKVSLLLVLPQCF